MLVGDNHTPLYLDAGPGENLSAIHLVHGDILPIGTDKIVSILRRQHIVYIRPPPAIEFNLTSLLMYRGYSAMTAITGKFY